MLYVSLFAIAAWNLVSFARRYRAAEDGMPLWRLLSVAPMLVAIVGSFVSLPILLLIVALGKIL